MASMLRPRGGRFFRNSSLRPDHRKNHTSAKRGIRTTVLHSASLESWNDTAVARLTDSLWDNPMLGSVCCTDGFPRAQTRQIGPFGRANCLLRTDGESP